MPRLANRFKLRSAILSWPAALATVVVIQAVLSFGSKPGIALSTYTLIPYFLLLVLATGVASVNAVQRTLDQRPFWAFLAAGYGLWALDSWLWVYRELVLHQKIPGSSIADPILFLHVIPFLAALATRPELGQASLRRHQTTLNFLLVLFFWVFLYAFLVFPFQFLPGDSIIYNLRYNVLYFGENLALIATLGLLIFRAQRPWKSLYWHLLGATGVYTTGSLAANTAIDLGGYYPGHWTDFVIIIAICWFVWIPLRARRLEPPTPTYVESGATGLQVTNVLAMLAVLMIPVMGAWELFQTEDWWMHRFRILVALCFMTLLALAAFIKRFAENRELKDKVLLSRERRFQSEERFRELLESVEAIVWEADAATLQVTFVTRGAERILGYSRRQWVETPAFWAEHLHPEDRGRALACEQEVLTRGEALSAEYRMQAADGRYLWFRDLMHSVAGPDGKAERLRGIMVDITASHQAEDALRESEERYRSLVEAAPDVIYTVSAEDGTLTSLNPAFETLTGWSRAEWLGKSITGIVHPDDLPVALETLQKASRGETQPPFELRVLSRSGEYLVGEFTSTPHVKDGKVVGELGIARDITARKRAEEALRESEDRYRDLVEHSNDLICTHDLTGTLLSVNPAPAKILGYTPEELLKIPMRDLVAPEVRKKFDVYLETIRREGAAQGLLVVQTRSGERRIWEYGNTLRTEGVPEPIVRGTARDVTQRHQAEKALRESQTRLELIARASDTGLWDWDLRTNTVYYSPEWKSQVGCSEDEVSNRYEEWESRVHPEDLPGAIGRVRNFLAHPQGEFENEFRFRHKDGSYRWILARGSVLKDNEGKPCRMLGSHLDVTERKRAEELLRRSGERFSKAFNASPEPMTISTLSGGSYIDVNEAFLRATGYQREEVVGHSVQDLKFWVVPDARASLLEQLGRGSVRDFEVSFATKSGEMRSGLLSAEVIEVGGERCLLAVTKDITERKQAEEAIQSLSRFPAENPNPILRLQPDLTLIYANPSARPLLQLWGCDVGQRVPADWARLVADAMASGADKEVEVACDQRVYSFILAPIQTARYVNAYGRDITERKRAEEALRTSEELYRVLFERNLAGIGQTSLDGRILNCNEAFARIVGYASRDELMSRRASDLWFDPAEREAFAARVQRAGILRNVELRLRRRDGEPVWVLENLSMVKRGERQDPIFEATIFDITERKQAEAALRSLAARNEALLGSVPDIIMEVNSDKIYTWVNPAGLEFFGEDVIGREAAHYFEGEQDTYNQLQPLFGGNENTIYVESWQRRRDGEKRLLAWWCRVLKDSNGNVAGALSTARDITERKQAEAALRESQEMFQKAFQASPDTMVIHSLSDGRHIDVNESFLRLIDYRREEVVGRTAMDLGLWWDLAQRDEYLRILREQGRVRDLEICLHTKSGEARTLLMSAEVIEIAGQDCAVAIGKDISHRKQAEQERTHLEEQLRQAQKMEAVGRLAGGVAHDFNNILTAINGYTQLVLRKLSPRHPLRQQLNEIRKAGERAASLTARLLAFSHRQTLVARVLDLNKVVVDTENMLRRVIGEDVELVIRRGHKLAKVLADPDQFGEVLVNLAVNARDAMPGGGRLTIETGNVDLHGAESGDLPGAVVGQCVMLAVSDTGVGMSKEVMEHMFEPFFTTKEQGKGTGLGLSMVYGIVEQSGGYVRVESEPGQGSTFRIYLPCARGGAGKPAPRSTKARLAKGKGIILVVEDELTVRQVVAAALRSSGYKVLEASSGEEAMRRLRQHDGPLRLLLTDLVMPGMDGRKVADSVRILHPEVKVVFMSGYTGDALSRHGVSDTQGSLLRKPFTLESLTRKVREVLKLTH